MTIFGASESLDRIVGTRKSCVRDEGEHGIHFVSCFDEPESAASPNTCEDPVG